MASSDSFLQRFRDGMPLNENLRIEMLAENERRRLFATCPDSPMVAVPHTGLIDVYGVNITNDMFLSQPRTPDVSNDGCYIMPLSPERRRHSGEMAVVPSLMEFERNWHLFSENSLQALDWTNVIAAGGAVLACLESIPLHAEQSNTDRRRYFTSKYKSSDIDLFLWGLNEQEAEAKIVSIYDAVQEAVPYDVVCVRTRHAVSIYSQYPYRCIQIILRLYKSPTEVVVGFDIDAPCIAYDAPRIAKTRRTRTIALTRRQCIFESSSLSLYRQPRDERPMTPDELTIVIVGVIRGTCLLSLLFSIIVLANAEWIRRILGIENPLPTLPAHYVLPYEQPRSLVEPVGTIHAPAPQRRSTYHATSSDEHLPPRNATPGPSNVPRTPPPAYHPADEAEEYGRFLRTVFRSPTPSLPLITIPDSPEAPIRALVPEPIDQAPRTPSPLRRQRLSGTLHTGGTRIATPAHLCPLPDSDDESNNGSDSSNYEGNEPVAEREDDDPLNPHGLDYEWPELDAIDRAYLGPYRSQAWELRRIDVEQRSRFEGPENRDETQTYAPAFMPTVFERNTPPPRETAYTTYDPEPTRSNEPSQTSYWPSHLPRETAPTWTELPDFDNFNQDPETFGWADKEDERATALGYQGYARNPVDDRDYRGYTAPPDFYHNPFPLPDSPYANNYAYQPIHPRRVQQYRPPQYGQYLMGGQDPPEPIVTDQTAGPSQPSNEERIATARQQSEANRREYEVLKAQLEAAQAKMMTHDVTWDFAQPPDTKGKEPDRGRPIVPNYRRPLYDRTDCWSIPRPPLRWQAPNPYPAPVGDAPDDAPWLGVKPIMVKPPLPFDGKYDDVERFVGDCFTYFEVFAAYFQVPSSRVVFAVTHLEGAAKDWWVHARQDFWANDPEDPHDPRFRFPSWGEFTTMLAQNFHDPASEELHEKRMFDLRMGKGPAISYFQELEMEAKKANRRGETDARGLMVKAVRLGVPDSYTNAIANSGQHVPITYNDWKRRVCIMYEERQKKWVFDQTVGNRPAPKNQGTTATSLPKTGGATGSTPPKQAGNSSAPKPGGRDSAGRWTTHPGQGLPMSVDAQKLRDEGRCFRCKEKGHLSRDCPKKKEFHDIRSVQATELAVTTKVEEDLHTGALSSPAGRSQGLFVGTPFNPTCIKRTNIFSTSPDLHASTTHSNIPRLRAPAFNVSSTTSEPVQESQNRYAALSVEECNNDNDTDTASSASNAEAEQGAESPPMRPLLTLGQTDANRQTSNLRGLAQPVNVSDEKLPTIVAPIDNASLPRMTDGTMSAPKGKLYDEAAQVERPSTPKVDVESQLGGETTARLPGQQRVPRTQETTMPQQQPFPVGRPGKVMEVMTSRSPGAAGGVGQPRSLDSTTPVVPARPFDVRDDAPVRTSPSLQRIVLVEANQTNLRSPIAPGNIDEERPSKAAGDANATATKKIAAGQEAASAQAVNRGHSVTCIEVPDEDDDTAFQLWLAKERLPTITQTEATSDEPAQSSTKPIIFQKWYKPFEVDWTLRAVCEA
ncbi:uncharacterized protein ARMOST_22239 [Armillaria ostoyae]|uniref:CCHC-type domain-containing protein n=1 Tax=Armillaria ostoyae TaxID=47428 RepID=A0A284SCA5_ARMOS|nr:uncharacterized protein ARMOST_22239 [Armillaria ostoyae]